jgi:hypothetical protein
LISVYNTPMGVSLRTLAKLTEPATRQWWRRVGNYLLAVGIAAALINTGVGLTVWRAFPQTRGFTVIDLILCFVILVWQSAVVCLALAALLAARQSLASSRWVGEEVAVPRESAPLSAMYTLALLRTWPAFLVYVLCRFSESILYYDLTVGRSYANDSLVTVLQNLLKSLFVCFDISLGSWLIFCWILAFLTLWPTRPWLAWAWTAAAFFVPALNNALNNIIRLAGHGKLALRLFGRLDTNFVFELCWTVGFLALIALVILIRHKRRAAAAGLGGLFTMGIVLFQCRENLLLIHPDLSSFELRFLLQNLAQFGAGAVLLPLELSLYCFPDSISLQIIAPVNFAISFPGWLLIAPLLLRLSALLALYFFISRVLLRESPAAE